MKLNYLKITATKYKFFYEGKNKAYGEFYMDIVPDHKTNPIAGGTAEIISKDPEYAEDLIEAFGKAMVS